MIIYKSEPLEKFKLENIEYFKCDAMCRMIEKYGIEQGIFKFELVPLTDMEKAFEIDKYMAGAEIYFYYGVQRSFNEMKEIVDGFRYLILKVEPKLEEDIVEVNKNLFLKENINIVECKPINNNQGDK